MIGYDLLENDIGPVLFFCVAIGEPVPTISWYFNTMLLSDSSDFIITTTVRGTVIDSSLIIMNPQSAAGLYICDAENVIGSDISAGMLTMNGKMMI